MLVPALLHAAGSDYLWDFRKEFLPAGRAVLDGDSPFPRTLDDLASHANYVYPPLAAFVMAPLTWLPQALAEGIFVALSLAAPALTLMLLRVRDWRCYGIVYLWPTLLNGVSLGTLSPLLALALAAGWRWRHSGAALGATLAGAAVVKLFMWPLLALFAAGGRWRACLVSIAGACLAVLASWALIGFAGFADYPRLLQELSRIEAPRGYSPTSLALSAGLPRTAALAFAVVVGLPLLRRRCGARAARVDAARGAVLCGRRGACALAGRVAALPRAADRADRSRARPPRARVVRAAPVLAHAERCEQRLGLAHRARDRHRGRHARARGVPRPRAENSALTCSQAERAASSGALPSARAWA